MSLSTNTMKSWKFYIPRASLHKISKTQVRRSKHATLEAFDTQSAFIFSPFSPDTVAEEHNRSLLIQFFLHEIFQIAAGEQQTLYYGQGASFGFQWMYNNGPLNKARAYAALLPIAFPKAIKTARLIIKTVERLIASVNIKISHSEHLSHLYQALEKLFSQCEDDENLLYFLLKHQKSIDALMGKKHLLSYFHQFYPTGLRPLEEMLCDEYHKRGFIHLIPELKELIAQLTQ